MAPQNTNPKNEILAVVKILCQSKIHESAHPCTCRRPPPSREAIEEIIQGLRTVLFPDHYGNWDVSGEHLADLMTSTLERYQPLIKEQIHRGLCYTCPEEERNNCEDRAVQAQSLTQSFFATLPSIQSLLSTDVVAAYEGDPAATSTDEAILCYPGMLAITNHRLAHELYQLGVPLIPRIITELAHCCTGIDIHPGARIGKSFFIDHGTGVVIGETSIIGQRVRLYQGVTLGAKSFPLDEHGNPIKGIDRHPIVEDDVIIYSEATILGRVTIGKGSVIGGNVWLTESVPPGSRVLQAKTQQEVFFEGSGI